jgi:uncharacterized protein YecE (DUF72 family)
MAVRIGTAGWAIPRVHRSHFEEAGSQLERYARVFPVVEINSTFRQEHREETFARWARSTPDGFRFSLKLPKLITHEHRLQGPYKLILDFLAPAQPLGAKLGPILVQLPPSLTFDGRVAKRFFTRLRQAHAGPVVCEPRNATWLTDDVEQFFEKLGIGRVAADPAALPDAGRPGGWKGLKYYRLHGWPRKYFSAYADEFITRLAQAITNAGEVWCIFDNTAHGAAAGDAVKLLGTVPPSSRPAFSGPPYKPGSARQRGAAPR